MAPSISNNVFPSNHINLFSPRAQSDPNNPPLASVFALIINRAEALAAGSISRLTRSLANRDTSRSTAPLIDLSIVKRQQSILVIPTTYDIRGSPAPGAVVGITLGAILGFLLILFLILWIYRFAYGGSETIIEEDIIRRRARSHRSKHTVSASSHSMSEAPAPPVASIHEEEVIVSRRESRQSRRESRRTSRMSRRPQTPEEVIVEEELSAEGHEDVVEVMEEGSSHHDDAVVVEEEEDDIVEVIEEHSPEPPPRRKSSRRSGHYRTIDPDQYGGGDAPSRRVSRVSRHS